ncbi:MAG: hypothetical protein KKC55_14600, partial [Gammaproteobacteria bacterium]|nr:hypothetical protein [Gammaproteobacteria bacterium]
MRYLDRSYRLREMGGNMDLLIGGDWHNGNMAMDMSAVKEFRKMLMDEPDTYAVLIGDLNEAFTVKDRRYSSYVHKGRKSTVDAQMVWTTDFLEPVADKVWAILDGNHERTVRETLLINWHVCHELGIDYGMSSTKLRLAPGLQMFFWHGAGSLRSTLDDAGDRYNSMCRSIRKRMAGKADDCHLLAQGHHHKVLILPPSNALKLVDENFITDLPD